jgi:hypothetical protein
MDDHQDLSQLLTPSYLDGMGDRPLDDIRSMRGACQQAEAELSYLRRLVQGRMDIVHAYLEHAGDDGSPDLAAVVSDLPGILSGGHRVGGPGRNPLLQVPDTESGVLTTELDAILGADEVGTLAGLGPAELTSLADRLAVLERRVSADRRALHERIDALQAELVDRYKSGRATLDGLLS